MKNFAEFVIRKRLFFLLLIAAGTLFFLYQLTRLEVRTSFSDLLPQKHSFIQVHNKIRHIFGGANQVLIMVQVREGDIFNADTLERVKWITRELESIPGVDPYKIRSIAVSKMKDFKFSSGEMTITPLMFPDVPQNDEEMQALRDKIYSNPRYYGQYVSYDSMKTMIMVDFFEDDIDYRIIFNEFSRIRDAMEDEQHIINIAGEPMHLGYITYHTRQVAMVLGITILCITIMLFVYYKCFRAVMIPIVSAFLSAIWGLGFMALVGFTLDPLILVLPFLISMMTARHSMQCISRFLDEYAVEKDHYRASVVTLQTMIMPGITSIITDALGIALIAIATIPILVNISITCSFWCVATIILSVVLTPLLLSYIPATHRMQKYIASAAAGSMGYRQRFLGMIGRWIPRRGKWYVAAVTVVIVTVGFQYAAKLQVGDFMPGSSILWPFHRYNKDAFRITFSMPLLNPLYVILEGDEGAGGFVTSGPTLREMNRFQRYMAKHDRVMFTYSIVNNLPAFLMSSFEDDPQWNQLPPDDRVLSFCARRLVYAGEPGTWDRYIDMNDTTANIVVYCRDKMPRTVESVINYIQAYLEETPGPPGGRYSLAGGAVGVQAGVREVIQASHFWNLVFALGGIFLFCAINFRSLLAGLILTIPLAISNVLTFAFMGAYHIGLTVNTYPVASVGIGLGVDYGIYFLSRLVEERRRGVEFDTAIYNTLVTNGKAIVQIATTLTIGLIIWVISPLKFQSEMGALLAIMLFLNMLGALLVVPTLICIIRPAFITRCGQRCAPEHAANGAP